MIFLYIALGVVACAGVGKIVTRSSDRNYKRWDKPAEVTDVCKAAALRRRSRRESTQCG